MSDEHENLSKDMTLQDDIPSTSASDTQALDAADQAAYEEFQARLRENRERREAAERLRQQAAALESGKPAPEDTETELAATLVDSWNIDSESLPAVLTQYHDQRPIARTILNQEMLEELLHEFNLLYLAPEETPLTWAVRYPDYSDIPVLTLFRGAQAIGSLPLDEEFGKPLGAILTGLYPTTPRVPLWARFKAWVRKHPAYSILIALVALPFVGAFLYGTVLNLIAYF